MSETEFKVTLGSEKFIRMGERFMAGDPTVLAFESFDYELGELHVSITDGSFLKRHIVKDAKLDITEYCGKAGVLEIRVQLVAMGAVLKTWQLEPFVVMENGGGFEFIPEIALLRTEIQTMKQAIKELNTKIDETM